MFRERHFEEINSICHKNTILNITRKQLMAYIDILIIILNNYIYLYQILHLFMI